MIYSALAKFWFLEINLDFSKHVRKFVRKHWRAYYVSQVLFGQASEQTG